MYKLIIELIIITSFSSVQLLSRVWLCTIPWTAARQASRSIINSRSLLKLMSIELVMISNHLIFCRPLLLLPLIFPSIRVFSNESVLCIRWPVSFRISPSNEYSGLISFRIDWFDFLAVEGTLKNLFQHHSSNASIKVSAIIIPILRRRNRIRNVHWFYLNHRKTVARSTKCTLSNTEAWHCFPI